MSDQSIARWANVMPFNIQIGDLDCSKSRDILSKSSEDVDASNPVSLLA